MPPIRLTPLTLKKEKSWMRVIRDTLAIIAILYGVYVIQQNWDELFEQGIEQIEKGKSTWMDLRK